MAAMERVRSLLVFMRGGIAILQRDVGFSG